MFSSNTSQVAATATAAEAVDFDGTNDYLTRASDLTGNTNNKAFTFSAWVWSSSASTSETLIYSAYDPSSLFSRFQVGLNGNQVRVLGYDTSNNLILQASGTLLGISKANTFYHVLFSMDLANPANRSIYVNDVSVLDSVAAYENFNIGFATSTHYVGARAGTPTLGARFSNVYFDKTYRDLSVTANRRLFVTADLKPAAGQAALNPILYLPMSDPTTVGTNAGTGGNFTLTGTIARSGRGPNQYNAPYSDLDGTADYLSCTTALTGIADGKTFTLSFCFNKDSASTKYPFTIYSSTTKRFRAIVDSGGYITIEASSSAGTGVLFVSSSAGSIALNRNYVITVSVDLTDTAKRHLYINGSAATATWSTYSNTDIDFSPATPRYYAGYDANPANFFDGRLGAIWFNTSYIDLSVASNLAKFVAGTGIDAKPVDLGATGELPTGTSPLIYLPMYGNNAGKNYGTGGAFTVNSGPYTGARGPNEFWSGSGLFNNPTQAEGISLELNNSPDVTGITKTTFAVCFKRRDVDVADNSVIFNTTSSTNNNFHFSVYFTDTEVLKVGWNGHTIATSSTITDTNWHTLLVSVDSTATVARVYLDGVSLTSTITLNRTYTQAFTYVGRMSGATVDQCFDGNIGFVYQAHDYIDISQEANRLKFFDAFGYPVDLSAQVTAGAIPAPYIYLLFPESNLGTNNGTAGNFTNNSVTASALVKA